MATYTIECSYTAITRANVHLPAGVTWDDLLNWYVRWDTLHYQLKSTEEWDEYPLNSDTDDIIDWKRPIDVTVFAVDTDGFTLWEDPVDTSSEI